MLTDYFIRRPILSLVVSFMIVLVVCQGLLMGGYSFYKSRKMLNSEAEQRMQSLTRSVASNIWYFTYAEDQARMRSRFSPLWVMRVWIQAMKAGHSSGSS